MDTPNTSCPVLARFVAYQRAQESSALVDRATASWRGRASLGDQARRAAESVVLNLAEGNTHAPRSPERLRYQRIALCSARETQAALDLAAWKRVGDAADLAVARTAANRVVGLLVRVTAAR